MKVTRGEFKNRAVLILAEGDDDKYPFTFGLSKAQKIIAAIEDIKKFVAEEEAKLANGK
jgi:hypothetical protein